MDNLLATMGITQWRLRGGCRGESDPRGRPGSHSPFQDLPQYRFIAQASQMDHPLLSNIIKAIGCTPSDADIVLIDNPEDLQKQVWPNIPTIIFGEPLHPYAPHQAIRTVSLLELSRNIPAKKSLWQQLKQLS